MSHYSIYKKPPISKLFIGPLFSGCDMIQPPHTQRPIVLKNAMNLKQIHDEHSLHQAVMPSL